MSDLTGQVTWSLTSTKGIAAFDTTVKNQLTLSDTEGNDQVTITATYNGPDAPAQVQASGTVTTSFP